MKKIKIRISSIFTAVLFLFNIGFSSGEEINIVYTANTSGKYIACDCEFDPYGGLVERVTLIRELREKEEPFLLVDGGNMVTLFGSYDLRASCVMRIMSLMNYDAAGAGWQEMVKGVESALKMKNEADFPLISSSIVKESDSTAVFDPYVISSVDDINVGIISVCDSTFFIGDIPISVNDYRLIPAYDVLKDVLVEISPKTDFVVVLSQLSPEKNKNLLVNFPEIDFIVESNHNRKYDEPLITSEGVIVAPGRAGQFVGFITLEKSKKGVVLVKRHELIPVLNFSEDSEAKEIYMEYLNDEN